MGSVDASSTNTSCEFSGSAALSDSKNDGKKETPLKMGTITLTRGTAIIPSYPKQLPWGPIVLVPGSRLKRDRFRHLGHGQELPRSCAMQATGHGLVRDARGHGVDRAPPADS